MRFDFSRHNRIGLSDSGQKQWGLGIEVCRPYMDVADYTAREADWQPQGWSVLVTLFGLSFGWASNDEVAKEYGIGEWPT